MKLDATVLDLGCGYGEFINNIPAARKLAMDLNPDAPAHLAKEVEFLHQDCSAPWPLADKSLDVVFTSNFFEHLPDKECLNRTLRHALRCLKPGGRLIAVGPNIKYLHGEYWDFYDHHVYLSETSLGEAMEIEGYQIEIMTPRYFCLSPWFPHLNIQCFSFGVYVALPLALASSRKNSFLWSLCKTVDLEPEPLRHPLAMRSNVPPFLRRSKLYSIVIPAHNEGRNRCRPTLNDIYETMIREKDSP